MKAMKGAIEEIIVGDLDKLSEVLMADHSELLHAAADLPQLHVSKSALVRVLKAWCDGKTNSDNVQEWASFVRRGYSSKKAIGALQPIDIAYDKDNEDLIVEIIGRLDEIGDGIDGTISVDERRDMLHALES